MAELYKPGVSHFLDMRRIASYAPDLGFSIAVDGLRNIPSKRKGLFNSGKDPPSVYKVITVVTPPGLFFQDPSVADDAQCAPVWKSTGELGSPRYRSDAATETSRRWRGAPDI